MKVGAIVLAAGKGSRMKAGINKQFLKIEDKPILYYGLKAFQDNKKVDYVVIVASEDERKRIDEEIVREYNFTKVKSVVAGGRERYDSVFNGLKSMDDLGIDIVLIHDGARPFVTSEIIDNGIQNAKLHGSCTCGVKAVDTIKIVDENGYSKETPDRENLFAVQTPQCFKFDIIYECHKKIRGGNIKVTDDTSVVEAFGHKVFLYGGDYNNIKVTTPKDMILAQEIYKNLFTK